MLLPRGMENFFSRGISGISCIYVYDFHASPQHYFSGRTACAFVHLGCINKSPKLLCSAYILLLHSCGCAVGRACIFSGRIWLCILPEATLDSLVRCRYCHGFLLLDDGHEHTEKLELFSSNIGFCLLWCLIP